MLFCIYSASGFHSLQTTTPIIPQAAGETRAPHRFLSQIHSTLVILPSTPRGLGCVYDSVSSTKAGICC
ncbi:hypothetical protein DACRYDRAFT_22650, partial [Dacryopinax primogenitus]